MKEIKFKDGTTLVGWILVSVLFGLASLGFLTLVLIVRFGYRFIEEIK